MTAPIGTVTLKFYATAERSPLIAGMYLVIYNGDAVIDVLGYRRVDGEWAWLGGNGETYPAPFAWAWLYSDAMIDLVWA